MRGEKPVRVGDTDPVVYGHAWARGPQGPGTTGRGGMAGTPDSGGQN